MQSTWKQLHQQKILLVGIFFALMSFLLAQPIFTPHSSLSAIKGNLDTAYLNIEVVSSTKTSYLITNTVYSHRATLFFMIKGCDKEFIMQKNVGDEVFDDEYFEILRHLQSSRLVEVSIKKRDLSLREPDVYQIVADKKVLVSIHSVRFKSVGIVILSLSISLIFIVLWFWMESPERFQKLFNHKFLSIQ